MNDNDKFKEMFENPYTKELIMSINEIISFSATRIASSCELIHGSQNYEKNSDTDNYLDGIIMMCRELLRLLAMNKAFTADAVNKSVLRLESFMEYFAANCRKALDERLDVTITSRLKVLALADIHLLQAFLLNVIRRNIVLTDNSRIKLYIGASRENDRIRLQLEVKSDSECKSTNTNFGFYDKYFRKITDIIAEKMDVDIEFIENGAVILMKECRNTGEIEMKTPFFYFDDDEMSLYRIMLSSSE